MDWEDLAGLLLLFVPLAVASLLYFQTTTAVVKWISRGLAAATFFEYVVFAHYGQAFGPFPSICYSVLFAFSLAAVVLHWVRPPGWLYRIGHCQKCGYDLTGNVSGICPECGQSSGGGSNDARTLDPPQSAQ